MTVAEWCDADMVVGSSQWVRKINRLLTCYGLDFPWIESRNWRDFSYPSRPARGPHSPLSNGYLVSFPGVKRPDNGVNHPPPYSAGVTEEVELYFNYPSVPSWQAIGRTLPLFSLSKKGNPSSVIRASLRTVF